MSKERNTIGTKDRDVAGPPIDRKPERIRYACARSSHKEGRHITMLIRAEHEKVALGPERRLQRENIVAIVDGQLRSGKLRVGTSDSSQDARHSA